MSGTRKPKLLVFDLDYTLWPFWVDTHVTPPFSKKANGVVVDTYGQKVKFYEEVPKVLEELKGEGYLIGIASRTGEVRGAESLLNLFGWNAFIDCKQIYPGCKLKHFKTIKQTLDVEYDEMIFFDDEQRNITDLKTVGVLSILVKNGVTRKVVQDALAKFARGEK
jgi:magnesium-dependent phosphatase 1